MIETDGWSQRWTVSTNTSALVVQRESGDSWKITGVDKTTMGGTSVQISVNNSIEPSENIVFQDSTRKMILVYRVVAVLSPLIQVITNKTAEAQK